MAKKMTQTNRVLDYMQRNGSITPSQAMRDLGCYRLGARIYDLRRQGHNITRYMVREENRFGEVATVAKYKLAREEA